ncbi:MAG: aldo/keto reductase [Deltaproteobacteria bacterium]|nr:aldo/keto reductase [Kofleriaceae bacterium]
MTWLGAGSERPIAIGAMRVTDERVLDAALRAGVTVVDTADVYGAREGENERLIAAALASWGGAPVTVISKSGLRREGERWLADGRATHVVEAAKASRERLGGGPLALHLLHAVDPQVPLATSVRGLARLLDSGDASRVGLSNVNRTQLEAALDICAISAVEVELGPHQVNAVRGGLVRFCEERGIPVLAYRPLGGVARASRWGLKPVVRDIAAQRGVTPQEVVLAWLRGLSPVVIPLPGVSRIETAASVARSARLALAPDELDRLSAAWLRLTARSLGAVPEKLSKLPPSPDGDGGNFDNFREVVVVMGMQGSGKSTVAREMEARGYARFNRDERGGSLDKMARLLDEALAGGVERAVLDNTYATRASRSPVIEIAGVFGVPVRCVWIDASIEDAQVNAAARLIETYDRLPEPGELVKLAKKDPAAFRPSAQFNWRRDFEPPSVEEGFAAVERVAFRRTAWPFVGQRRALIVEMKVAEEVDVGAWRAAGWLVVGTAWEERVVSTELDVVVCPHPAGPPVCWCRKPLPGLGLLLTRRHGIDLARSWHVGRGPADKGFAARLGLRFADPAELPAPPPLVD